MIKNVGQRLIQHLVRLEQVSIIQLEHVIVAMPSHNRIHVLLDHFLVLLVFRLSRQIGSVILGIVYQEHHVSVEQISNSILVQMEEV